MASSKREKELARQRAERQAARRAAAAQRKKQRQAIIASVVAVLLIAGAAIAAAVSVGGGDDGTDVAAQPSASAPASAAPTGSAAPSAAASPAAAGDPGCEYPRTDTPATREVELPPTEGVETEQVFLVTIATNRGDIVFEMDSAKAPCTANNLRSLAHFQYFDDTPCHRLTTEGISVLQCGSPDGSGNGGPGYSFKDENLEGATYERGTVAMANSGPATNGSQFFLVYEDSALPPNYTPFGTIVSGLEVLEEIAAAGSDESNGVGDGKPNTPVQITTLRAKPKAA
ncbi:MAG: peptidylprolyl isomerase [Frankiales bacterium]|nr:MAG: peptidylprolyl isomerase [Frankiales bacterium]